ncbi:hypothetical protein KRR39_19540 [Nocardioides panacis]|uniref:Uncharacterized protein n=1 Tax=Nocardioides panacis TaxID=2849501 RepID=A0A975SYJ0_9ACTN|nr:hypothetical protein [Nocardioides panacis]QWZ07593.1 hypothetical protein KRR39_19540 [Nocardioides panacis]
MSDGYGVTAGSIPLTTEQWRSLQELMVATQDGLAAESPSGFAPSVRGAAATFLAAWTGYAGESSTLADGFVRALGSTDSLYGRTDALSEVELGRLDGRLGPAR